MTEMPTQTYHFSFNELACKCRLTHKFESCKGLPQTDIAIDARVKLQNLRDDLDIPMVINSAYRCLEYNTEIGSRPTSQHVLATAFDVSTVGMTYGEISELIEFSRDAGFRGIGLYDTFIHIDTGSGKKKVRKWNNSKDKIRQKFWTEILALYK